MKHFKKNEKEIKMLQELYKNEKVNFLIVGATGTGKTTLANLITGEPILTERYEILTIDEMKKAVIDKSSRVHEIHIRPNIKVTPEEIVANVNNTMNRFTLISDEPVLLRPSQFDYIIHVIREERECVISEIIHCKHEYESIL